jgi:hypothetical protein
MSVIPFETSAEAESDGCGSDQRVRRRNSRRKGLPTGLTSHTVIENLEDPRCYRAFERSIVGSFDPRTVAELELIHRLASLLWRLRRASAIETGLLQMQGEFLLGNSDRQLACSPRETSAVSRPRKANGHHGNLPLNSTRTDDAHTSNRKASDVTEPLVGRSPNCSIIAQCFLRLSRLDPALLDRVGAYEVRLWRQAAQTIWILDAIRRPPLATRRPYRKPVPHYLWDRGR